MKLLVRSVLSTVAVLLAVSAYAWSADVVLTFPGYDHINASALDQPELDAVITDAGATIYEDGDPVILDVFIDTGSSGSVISYMNAVGYDYEPLPGLGYDRILSLGLDGVPDGEFIGVFTETGIGGQELGDVTRNFGVKLLNAPQGTSLDPADFQSFGEHNLWVRQAVGIGEVVSNEIITLVDPVNVVGMPVISQRVLALDPTPMADLGRLGTLLLSRPDPRIPQTNVTLDVYLANFVADPPPGEVLPSHHDNPVVRNITMTHTASGQTLSDAGNNWLFDTGSGSTFISFAEAQGVGLIDESYSDMNDFLPDHVAGGGLTNDVGGIGTGSVTVPILRLDEIRIAAREGFDVVWPYVDVMVIDIENPSSEGETLDGVFGMNLLVLAVTVDPNDPLGSLYDWSPGYFDAIVFDPTDPNRVELRLYTELAPETTVGDASRNGRVDDDDLSLLLANWNLPADWGRGDFSADYTVDDDDLSLLLANWGAGFSPPPAQAPEPATIVLLVLGALGLLSRRSTA